MPVKSIPAKRKAAAPPVRTTQIRKTGPSAVSARTTTFKFVPRSREFVQRTLARPKGRYDSPIKSGYDIVKLREGDNTLRILPQTWTNEEAHYSFQCWQHRFIGPNNSTFLCREKMLDEPCPACDGWRELVAANDDDAWKAGPQQRYLMWVLHRQAENPLQPAVLDVSRTQDDEILSRSNPQDGSLIIPEDPDQGFDLFLRRRGTGIGTKYGGHDFARTPSPIHEDPNVVAEILEYIVQNPIPDVLQYHDAEYMQRVVFGNVEQTDPDLDAAEEEGVTEEHSIEERRPARRQRLAAAEPEEEVVEEEVAPEDETDEAGEPPFDEDEGEAADEGEGEEEEVAQEEYDEPVEEEPAPRRVATTTRTPARNGPRPAAAKSVVRTPAATRPAVRPAVATRPAVRPALATRPATKPAAKPVARAAPKQPAVRQPVRRTYRD